MLKLSLKPRTQLKRKAKMLYKDGYIPGVLYGPAIQSVPVSVGVREFERVYASVGESMLVSIAIEGEDTKGVVLIRNPQRDVVSKDFIHTDFYQLPLDKPVEVAVPIATTGESRAVLEMDGVLIKNVQDITIRVLPQALIQELVIDISSLEDFDTAITFADIPLPDGVEIVGSQDTVVFSVQQPRVQAEIEREQQEDSQDTVSEETETGEEEQDKTTEENSPDSSS